MPNHPPGAPRALAILFAGAAFAAACQRPDMPAKRESAGVRQSGAPAPAHFDAAAWTPPPESAIPNDSLGAAIRRGLALVTHTADSLPAYAPGRLNCSNCHLDAGRNVDAAPLAGAHARVPKYMDRTGAVIGLADRVNHCFTRSLGGNRLAGDRREECLHNIEGLETCSWLVGGRAEKLVTYYITSFRRHDHLSRH